MLWDSFSPIACDTHVPASEARTAFLRLLHQRGIDFQAAFDKYCSKLKDPSGGLTSASCGLGVAAGTLDFTFSFLAFDVFVGQSPSLRP